MMRSRKLFHVAFALLLAASACQRRIATWQDVARASGCTQQLLAHSAPYDTAHVRDLAGSYRLVVVDTAPGWVTLQIRYGEPPEKAHAMRLWAPDTLVTRWRANRLTGALRPANRPIVGAVPDWGDGGFTDMNPQAEIDGPALRSVSIAFTSRLMLDGPGPLTLPIERAGDWGFGGYFVRPHDMVVPTDGHGKLLPEESGFYCAFRT